MRIRTTLAAIVIVCCGPGAAAQQSAQDPRPAFRSGIELVTFDVGVVDKQGQPLRALTPGDFTVTVSGTPRRVVSADFIDTQSAQARGNYGADVVPVSSNEGGGIGRLFVFVVDQSTLDSGHLRNVATAASKFLSKLTFADRSAMMVLPVGPTVGFTWAHDRVRDALQRVTGTARAMFQWEGGTLAEAREIANRNAFTLRSVAERECGASAASASAGFGGAGGGSGGAGAVAAPAPIPGGGGPPSSGGSGGGGAPAPAGGGGGAGGGSGGTGSTRGSGGGLGLGSSSPCMRELQMNAEMSWRTAQMMAQSSIASLRQLLSTLERVHGDKTVILISGGWPLDERDETTLMQTVAAEAAAARATLFTVYVPVSMYSADRRMMSMAAPARDQYMQWGPLDTLASLTGGGSMRAEVGAELAFDRLARELSGYYRLGVEKEPGDSDAKGRRMKVEVARSGATVRARPVFDMRTYEDRDWAARLAAALEAPVPAGGIGLRVTSYIAADPEDASRVKLVLTGEASRLQRGETTLQVLVRDMDGKKVLAAEPPPGESTGDVLPFSTTLPIAPGTYLVRVAAMDSSGRVGSVEHRVDARPTPLGPIAATGPLLVRVSSGAAADPRLALDSVAQDERLAMEIDLRGDAARLSNANVMFEVAASATGPALVHSQGSIGTDSREGILIAQGVTDMRMLPPGNYVARVRVTAGAETLGELRRAFTVAGAAPPAVGEDGTVVTAPGRPIVSAARSMRTIGVVAPFRLEEVLAPEVVHEFLDRAGARSGTDGPLPLFMKGLALLEKRELESAANAFRDAMRASVDFYPAMVYLGACYAAGGNDKEAASAWRTALIKEGDAPPLHRLLVDALLRQGRGDMALEMASDARAHWPEDGAFKRQFAVAALAGGKPAEGLKALDELIERNAADEPSLALALLTIYEAFQNGRPIEDVGQDRTRMLRLADLYRVKGGPSLPLVETWVAAMTARK